jgi:ankyrin repeat protein
MVTVQRWERPFNFPPGYWKRQLPARYLKIAARGDLNLLGQLLAEHPEFLSKRGSHNRTLLWEAARKGRLAAVQWLMEQGADIDATGSYNSESYVQITPYCAAVYYKRPDVAAYLYARQPLLDIFRAAFLGDLARVADILAAEPALLNAEDPHDNIYFTPVLAFAVAGGHLSMLRDLLERGAVVPSYSAQLLSLAARASRLDMIELLVVYGAEIPAVDTGIYVDISDLRIARYLLEHGASANQKGKNGFPPLIHLARGDKGEHVKKIHLLLDYGAAVNAVGPHGRTALHYAARAGYMRVIRLLLDAGANLLLRDEQGCTALSCAREAGKTQVVEFLASRM